MPSFDAISFLAYKILFCLFMWTYAPTRRLFNSVRQFLIHSTFVLVI